MQSSTRGIAQCCLPAKLARPATNGVRVEARESLAQWRVDSYADGACSWPQKDETPDKRGRMCSERGRRRRFVAEQRFGHRCPCQCLEQRVSWCLCVGLRGGRRNQRFSSLCVIVLFLCFDICRHCSLWAHRNAINRVPVSAKKTAIRQNLQNDGQAAPLPQFQC